MNNWLSLVIPLVGLAVWILSNLVKNQQEEARRQAMRPRPNNADNPNTRENFPRREPPVARKVERPRPPVRPIPPQNKPQPIRPSRRPPLTQSNEPAPIPQAIIVVPASSPTSAASPTTTTSITRPSSKAIQNVYVMLKDRTTLTTAFLLKEVLGRPLCKKNLSIPPVHLDGWKNAHADGQQEAPEDHRPALAPENSRTDV